jgi:hypothetical protein
MLIRNPIWARDPQICDGPVFVQILGQIPLQIIIDTRKHKISNETMAIRCSGQRLALRR